MYDVYSETIDEPRLKFVLEFFDRKCYSEI